MKAAIDPKQAKDWFGGNPPDLTLIARSRSGHGGTGADYLYTYLRTYLPRPDQGRPAGTTWPSRAWACRTCCGSCRASASRMFEKRRGARPRGQGLQGLEAGQPGTMTPLQYDQAVGDLVGYLQWMAEPAQNHARAHRRLGAAVPGRLHGHRLAPERGVLERLS